MGLSNLSDLFAGEQPQGTPSSTVPKLSSALAPEIDQMDQGLQNPFTRTIAGAMAGTGAAVLRAAPRLAKTLAPTPAVKWFIEPAVETVMPKTEALAAKAQGVAERNAPRGLGEEIGGGIASTILNIPLAPFTMYDESYRAAVAGGATEEEAQKAAIPGWVTNTALEYVGMGKGLQAIKAIRRIPKPGLQKAVEFAYHVARSSVWEGGTEAVQQTVNNLVSKNYDITTDKFDTTGALDGAARAGLIGAASSAILFGLGGAVASQFPSRKATVEGQAAEESTTEGIATRIENGQAQAPPSGSNIDSMVRVAMSIPKGVAEIAGKGIELWSTPLVQAVEDNGTAVGAEFGAEARKAIDSSKGFIAKWQEPIAEYQRHIAGRTPEQHRTYQELREIVPVGDGSVGVTKFQQAVENDAALDSLSPKAKDATVGFRRLVRMVGDSAVEAGVQIQLPSGEVVPFTGEAEGRRLSRTFTPEAWEILEAGEGDPAYQQLVKGIASIPENGMTENAALAHVNALREDIILKRAPFEVARTIKVFPSHLIQGWGKVPLLYADPFSASQAFTHVQANRLGYITQFGQDETKAADVIARSLAEGGKTAAKQTTNLVRALQGIPVDEHSKVFPVGSAAYQITRGLRFLVGMQRTGLLTTSFIPNLAETISTVPMTVGSRRYLQSFVELVKKPHADPALEISRQVGHTIDVLNWNFDHERAIESINRTAANIGVNLAKQVNEANEIINASAALKMAQDLKEGRGTMRDLMRLELLRFSPAERALLMDGSAPNSLYTSLVQRAVETGQGTTSVPAERSRLANNRYWRFWVPFDSYAQKTANRTLRLGWQAFDAHREAIKNPSKATLARAAISEKNLAQWVGGVAAGSSFAILMRAALYDGIVGAASKLDEAAEDWKTFLIEATHYGLLSGAGDIIVRSAGSEKPSAEAVENLLPVRVFEEVTNATLGRREYAGYDGIDRFTRVLERNVVAFRPLQSWAAVMGLGARDRELEVAIKRYWSWMRKNQGIDRGDNIEATENAAFVQKKREFRGIMRKAQSQIRSGADKEAIIGTLKQAVGKGNVSQSLYGKRLLPDIRQELRKQFIAEFPPEMLKKIQKYDALLTAWGDAAS